VLDVVGNEGEFPPLGDDLAADEEAVTEGLDKVNFWRLFGFSAEAAKSVVRLPFVTTCSSKSSPPLSVSAPVNHDDEISECVAFASSTGRERFRFGDLGGDR